MIKNYVKHLEKGKKLMASHSPHHQLSAEALRSLIQDCDGDMWSVCNKEYLVGIAVGYRMAERDRKKEKLKE